MQLEREGGRSEIELELPARCRGSAALLAPTAAKNLQEAKRTMFKITIII